MTFRLAGAGHAILGARSSQEDSYGFWPPEGSAIGQNGAGLLALVADGMGGHRGGALASRSASTEFLSAFSAQNGAVGDRLGTALQAGNAAISRETSNDPSLAGMGCTLVAAWVDQEGLRWVSVGDSLLLLCRFPQVIRLNADHSLGSYLDEQVRLNQISEREARENRHRHALRSALTGKQIDLIDLRGEAFELKAGDWLLMASDGIFTLTGDEIGDIVFGHQNASPQEMAEALTAAVAAKRAAEQDNTTVIAVHISDHADVSLDDVITRIVRAPSEPVDLTTVKTRPMIAPAEPPRRPAGAPNPLSHAMARLEDGLSNAGAWVYFAGLAALIAACAAVVYMIDDGAPGYVAKPNPSPPILRNDPVAATPPPQQQATPPPPAATPQQQAAPTPPAVPKATQAGVDAPPGGNPSSGAPHSPEGANRSAPPSPDQPPLQKQSDPHEADLARR